MADKADTGQTGKKPKEKKIDLNVPQVAGGAVAAVVAAKLASSFGVYGTILGAGLVSVIATCGGTVFQHFFSRTGEQVREVAVKAKPRGRQVPMTSDGRPVPSTFRPEATATGPVNRAAAAGATSGPVTTTWRPGAVGVDADRTTALPTVAGAAADADRTTVLPTVAGGTAAEGAPGAEKTQLLSSVTVPAATGDATQMLPRADETMLLRKPDAAGTGEPGTDEETRLLGAALPLDGVSGPDQDGATDEYGESTVHGKRIKSWKRPLLGAALVFGVTMAGITAYEMVSGDSFSGGPGTTVGNAWRPDSANSGSRHDDTPKGTPSTPSTDGHSTPGTGQQSPGTNDPTGSPDDGRTHPTPTPSPSHSDKPTPTPTPTPPTPTPTPPTPDPSGDTGGADGGQGQSQGGTPE
ncbi:hypothetical protein ACFQVC_00630 [Streptomyces monticola]|uniref:Uncharacterized protein n=1 Tax=Streptomyces monticola TaxID=2666263 RepID=A0ABW2J9Q1_9ACTN